MKRLASALFLVGSFTAAHAQVVWDTLEPKWPSIKEGWGNGPITDDGLMHIDGDWSVWYSGKQAVQIESKLATFSFGPRHVMQLTVPAGQYAGAEIASDRGWSFDGGKDWPYGKQGYGYGFYETRMITANVGNSANNTGVVNSFFLKGAPCCGVVQEIDFEFLTNESWLTTSTGAVHCTISWPGGSISKKVDLPFNPSKAGHAYGLAWTPDGTVKFYADRILIETLTNSSMVVPPSGVIVFANVWTGNPNWGGLPPEHDAVATYGHISYWPNLTSPPTSAKLPGIENLSAR